MTLPEHRQPGKRWKCTSAKLLADIVAALMWGPKTIKEIREAVAYADHHNDRVKRYVLELHGAGVVYVYDWPRKNACRYAMNVVVPFEHKDVPHP